MRTTDAVPAAEGHEETALVCEACGRPLERADDFWYCDNTDCPRHQRAARPAEPERR